MTSKRSMDSADVFIFEVREESYDKDFGDGDMGRGEICCLSLNL